MGCAVECRARVDIQVDVTKAGRMGYFGWPQINNDVYICSFGFVDNSLEKSVQHAAFDLVKIVEHECRVTFMDAYMLIGQCVEIEICQFTGEFRSVTTKSKRKYIG